MNVRIAAAITFKNFVKHNWHMVCSARLPHDPRHRKYVLVLVIYFADFRVATCDLTFTGRRRA
jgi:hypothetical protein